MGIQDNLENRLFSTESAKPIVNVTHPAYNKNYFSNLFGDAKNSIAKFLGIGIIVAATILAPNVKAQTDTSDDKCKNPAKILPFELNSVLTSEHLLQPAAIDMYTTTPYTDGSEIVLDLTKYDVKSTIDGTLVGKYHFEFQPMKVSELFAEYHKRIDNTCIYNDATKKQKHKNLREQEAVLKGYVMDDNSWKEFVKDGQINRYEFENLDYGLNAVKMKVLDESNKIKASVLALVYRGPGYTPEEPKIVEVEKKVDVDKTDNKAVTPLADSGRDNKRKQQKEDTCNAEPGWYFGIGTEYMPNLDANKFLPRLSFGYSACLLDVGADVGVMIPFRTNYDSLWTGYNGGFTKQEYESMHDLWNVGLHALVGWDFLKFGVGGQYNMSSVDTKTLRVRQRAVDPLGNMRDLDGLIPPPFAEKEDYFSGGFRIKLDNESMGALLGMNFSKKEPAYIAQIMISL